ncbi:hypothetical protein SLS62_006411 [Diatrype stigma]|uniref:Uncharacterized protein n=1 Tax=Diatrype stigma TaxID=117547 RepID=A0AAN9UPE4_9PEZI
MAQSTSLNFCRNQLIEDNCEFISNKDDYISVVTERTPGGDYKAFVLRSNDDCREPLISSDPAETLHKAFDSLLVKSCEAVYHYRGTNGFSNPPDIKKANFDADDDSASAMSGGSESSTATYSEGDSSEEDELITPATSLPDKENPAATTAAVAAAARHGDKDLPRFPSSYRNTLPKKSRKSVLSEMAATAIAEIRQLPPTPRDHRSLKRDLDIDYDDESDEDAQHQHQHQHQNQNQNQQHHYNHLQLRYASQGRAMGSSGSGSSRAPPPPPGWSGPPAPPSSIRGGPQMMMVPPQLQPPPQNSGPTPAAVRVPIPPPPPAVVTHLQQKQQQPSSGTQRMPGPPPPPVAPGGHVQQQQHQHQHQYQKQQHHPGGPAPPPPAPISSGLLSSPPCYQHYHHNNGHRNEAGGSVAVTTASNSLYDVRLTIRWIGTTAAAEPQRILASVRPSIMALQDTALRYFHMHMAQATLNCSSGITMPSEKQQQHHRQQHLPAHMTIGPPGGNGNGSNKKIPLWNLHAIVRQALFGPDADGAYDMTTYRGDDLTKLFAVMSNGSSIPSFDIDIVDSATANATAAAAAAGVLRSTTTPAGCA